MLEVALAFSAFAGAKVAVSRETAKLYAIFFHYNLLFSTDGAL